MNSNDLLEMSQLEVLLKSCFMQKNGAWDHIFNPEELVEYIRWLAAEFGNKPGYHISPAAIPDMKSAKLTELGTRILLNPQDTQAFSQLLSGYSAQREERYITAEHDISVARVLRYMPAHWHSNDYFEVYYSFSGNCPIYFQNEIVTLQPGGLIIVAPGVMHANPCYEDDSQLVYYMLRHSTFERVFWSLIPKENLLASFFRRALYGRQANAYLHFETGDDPDFRHLMLQIYTEYVHDEPYSAQLTNALMSAAFPLLLRRYEGTARLPRTGSFFWKHEYSAILSYIQSRSGVVKLSELSDQFHYNEKQIRRIVQNATGLSFSDLTLKLKMEKAVALLQKNCPAEMIAEELGYTAVSSFYRAFSSHFGRTPGDYRQKSS